MWRNESNIAVSRKYEKKDKKIYNYMMQCYTQVSMAQNCGMQSYNTVDKQGIYRDTINTQVLMLQSWRNSQDKYWFEFRVSTRGNTPETSALNTYQCEMIFVLGKGVVVRIKRYSEARPCNDVETKSIARDRITSIEALLKYIKPIYTKSYNFK